MKKFLLFTFLCLVSFIFVSSASAASVMSFIQTGINQASDDDREYLIDRFGTVRGQLDIGDSFRGLININAINDTSANLGGATGNNELTGVFQVMVVDIVGSTYYFAPDPAFQAELDGMLVGTHNTQGAIAAFFEDSSVDFAADFDDPSAAAVPHAFDDGTPAVRTVPPSSADVSSGNYATEEAFIDTAKDGDLFAILGFAGPDGIAGTADDGTVGAGEGAYGTVVIPGFDNVLAAFTQTTAVTGVVSNLALNVLEIGANYQAALQINRVTTSLFGGVVDFALTQNLRGVGDLDTAFEVSSNTDISFNATVIPEPTTILLLGMGLLGLGITVRKRNK